MTPPGLLFLALENNLWVAVAKTRLDERWPYLLII